MKRFFYLLLVLTPYLFSDPCGDIAALNDKISSSNDNRAKLNAKIVYLEDQADRWQFRSEFYQDARRAWQQADMLKEAVVELDAYILELEKKKAALQEKNPQCR